MNKKTKKPPNEKPLSLYPMKLSEALKKAMEVPAPKKDKRKKN